MNILFIDDEKTTFEILKKTINWGELDITHHYTSSALKGIEIIKKNSPDIVITDIVMPDMDGLELIEWIKDNNFDCEIIIISAYGKFEYAQIALNFGITGYLLKPINETELIKLLNKAKNNINSLKRKLKIIDNIFNNDEVKAINTIICNSDEIDKSRALIYFEDIIKNKYNNVPFRIIFIALEKEFYNYYIDHENKSTNIIVELESILKLLTKNNDEHYVTFKRNNDSWEILLFNNNSFNELSEKIKVFSSETYKLLNIKTIFFISDIIYTLNEFYSSYKKTLSLQKQVHLFDDNNFIYTTSETDNIKLKYDDYEINTAAISINRAKEYINSHFDENINLTNICKYAGVSKNYFCNLFKKETDKNIWDYLTDIRISNAKKLLESTDLKNYEISLKIGYEDTAYFSKLFKKTTGLTPREYRKSI